MGFSLLKIFVIKIFHKTFGVSENENLSKEATILYKGAAIITITNFFFSFAGATFVKF